jgi:glucoamylase
LELVRYGIRKPDDAVILDSLRVVDAVLKVDTPVGPCWRRYNNDGFGQRADGSSYQGWGVGHAWPLLTGERGHYELAAGHNAHQFVRTMEGFASRTGLLPEQVWDAVDIPEAHMFLGKPTGAAMPLMWAHGEYIKLLRSVHDGKVFDLIPAVAERYITNRKNCRLLEVWKHNRQCPTVQRGYTLRIQCRAAFRLHWSADEWQTINDTPSTATALGIEFTDIAIASEQRAPVRFTFFWNESEQWEGKDYVVAVK